MHGDMNVKQGTSSNPAADFLFLLSTSWSTVKNSTFSLNTTAAFYRLSNSLYITTRSFDAVRSDLLTVVLNYRGADNSLARPGRKQATATKL